ncbi:glycine zipper 2TM domain-containing protein [Collimonas pratensis]|uniref:Glycine zipper 2TM domain protein n=1 Tax=Collimonas pratensis TaxID=279113 RepID=A0A127Q168_9BURK|nr:glycine zipper 2TM domain-containing protein [Collimonas pratensis]AMP03771.1 glycine zipper 2TM domain protein [Collimonas pratensis]AMP13723.1 glycine zipper 2TM domain protein [Collimonas pratensis]
MDNPKPSNRIHPLVATAAVAVTLASLVGVAAMTGLFPSSQSTPASVAAMAPGSADYNQQQQPLMNNGAQQGGQNGNYAQAPMQSQQPQQQAAPRPEYAQAPRQSAPLQPAICHSCGQVESIQAIQHAAPPSGLGIAAGAVLGGVLGHQVGHGNGNTLATVAGAVGGGFAGNEVEKRTRTNTTYQVMVRMEDGKLRSFPQSGQGWRVGDPVRVVNGHLEGRG